jgi:hypothetical protein
MAEMKGLMNLTFGSQNTILWRCPQGKWSFTLLDTVEKINQMTKGHVVIAHVDRYDPNKVETLFDMGFGASSMRTVFADLTGGKHAGMGPGGQNRRSRQ